MAESTESVATLTLTGRLWKTRGVSFYFALMAAALVVSLAAAVGTWNWVAHPSLNLPVLSDLTMRGTVGYWAGTRDGDRLVDVAGTRVTSLADLRAFERTLPEGPTLAHFSRDGAVFELTGEMAKPRPAHAASLWLRCLAGIAFFVIGGATFLLRPGTRASWLFLLACVSSGVVLLSILFLHHDVVLRNLVPFSALGIAAGLQIHFFAEFPQRARLLARRPWVALTPHLPALVLIPAVARSMQVGAGEVAWPVAALLLWCAATSIVILGLLVSQWRTARRSLDARAQAQVRALAVATVIGMVLPAGWTLAWLFGLLQFPGVVHVGTVPFVLFAGIVAHTLVRHNAFDVDRFTARVAGYAAATVTLGACFLLALVGLPLLLGRLGIPRSPELFVVLTSMAFVAFLPIFSRLKVNVDRFFLRSGVDAAKQADALRELSFVIQTGERERGLRAALTAARTAGADRAEYWSLDEASRHFNLAETEGAAAREEARVAIPRHGPLGDTLALVDDARGIAGLAHATLPRDAQEELWKNELAVAVPVKVHGRLAGFLGVGRKASGGPFVPAECAFLSAVATSLSIVVEQGEHESRRLGRYRLGKRLGTGGMAEVHLAFQLGPGGFERKVALKRPLPHLADDPQAVAMFLDEARISAQLSHKNIVTIHEVDRQDGHYLIAMEYVDGATLRSAIRWSIDAKEPVPLPVALHVAASVLAALSYAHAAIDAAGKPLGLVHRDVTPANILVSFAGEVKLMDFGIARAAERQTATRTGSIKGTIPYMSPEQAAGAMVDARSDLYSAGAMLYELFTSARAFPDGPEDFDFVPATVRRPELPATLDAFFTRAMAFRAEARPPRAREMLDELLAAASPFRPAAEEEVARWLKRLVPATAPAREPGAVTAETADDPERETVRAPAKGAS